MLQEASLTIYVSMNSWVPPNKPFYEHDRKLTVLVALLVAIRVMTTKIQKTLLEAPLSTLSSKVVAQLATVLL